MNKTEKHHTYHYGQKIVLGKSTDQMFVRAMPNSLGDSFIATSEYVSSASTRIKTSEADLELLMERDRKVVSAHHAYYENESGCALVLNPT